MAKLIIMTGVPFSGKTYLSKKIAEKLGCERVSYDEIWDEKRQKLDKWFGWEYIIKIVNKRLISLLGENHAVIYDGVVGIKEERDDLVHIAEEAGAECQIIYMNTPEKIRLERHKRNKITEERHDIRNRRFRELPKFFDKPKRDENCLEFRPIDNVDEWIETNLGDVKRDINGKLGGS